MLALERESKGFNPSVYLEQGDPNKPEQRKWLMTEASYITRFDEVKGKLTFTESCLEFKVNRDAKCTQPHEMYDVMIDYLDIESVCRLQIPNEEAVFNQDDLFVKNYMFNYMVQIEVSTINGLTVGVPKSDATGWNIKDVGAEIEMGEKSIIQRSNVSLANMFFKMQHEEKTVKKHILINKEEEKVVDYIIDKLESLIKAAPFTDYS